MMYPKPEKRKRPVRWKGRDRLHSVAEKRQLNGFTFDSRLEGDLYIHLNNLQREGRIRDLRTKPNVYLTRARILIIRDFSAHDVDLGKTVYYEAKGFETETWKLKRRLWKHYGPGVLRVYWRSGKMRLKEVEAIVPDVLPSEP